MILELAIILFLAILFRVIFTLGKTCDQDFHVYYLRYVEKDGLAHPDIPDSLVKGFIGYPSLPHYIITLFPKKYWGPVGRVLNLAYDLATLLVVYFAAYALFTRVWPTGTAASPDGLMSPWGWVGLLYATAPIMFPITARLKAMGGRTIGPLLVTLYLVFLGYALVENRPWFLIACVPFGVLTIIASIFGTQVLFCFSVLLALLLQSPLPLAALAASFAASVLIPGIDAKKVIVTNLHLYKWYIRSIDKNSPIANRNRFKNYLTLWRDAFRDPIRTIQTVFENTSWFILLYCFPALFILIAWIVRHDPGILSSGGYEAYLGAIVATSVIVFVLTSIRPLTIFGQAERYTEYAAPAVLILFVHYALQMAASKTLFILFLANILGILVNFMLVMGLDFVSQFTSKLDPPTAACVQSLKGLSNPKIVTIPSVLSVLVASNLDNPQASFHYDWITVPGKGYQYMLDEREAFQYARTDLGYFVKNYGTDTFIVRKRYLAKAADLGIHYRFDGYLTHFENEDYVVYLAR